MAQTLVTLNDLEVHSSVSELFKCKSSTFCAELYKISTGTPASRGPLATAGLLVFTGIIGLMLFLMPNQQHRIIEGVYAVHGMKRIELQFNLYTG